MAIILAPVPGIDHIEGLIQLNGTKNRPLSFQDIQLSQTLAEIITSSYQRIQRTLLLQEEITERELYEWMAFYRIEPFGEERADLRAGIVASVLANANRRKGAKAFMPRDFMPYAKMEDERQRVLKRPKGTALGKKARAILSGIAKRQNN